MYFNLPKKSDLKKIKREDFLSFGCDTVAYIKQIKIKNKVFYCLFGADGLPLVIENTIKEVADFAAEKDICVVTLH